MIRGLLALLLVLIPLGACRQDRSNVEGAAAVDTVAASPEGDTKTKLERFAAKHGVAVIRGSTQVGTIGNEYGVVNVGADELTNASTNQRERGIWIRVAEADQLERQNTSSIDYDEIDSLIRGIDYIAKANSSITKFDKFQADYATVGDFRVSTFGGQRQNVMASVRSGQIGGTQVFLTIEELQRLRHIIANAKKTLDDIASADSPAR